MTKTQMTFHESYGNLPTSTLRLIKRHNVSPADLDLMTDLLGNGTWDDIDEHIVSNSKTGMYTPRFF